MGQNTYRVTDPESGLTLDVSGPAPPSEAVLRQMFAQAAKTRAPEPTPAEQEGSAAGRFVSGAAEMLNPVTIGEGIYQTIRHPIDSIATPLGEEIKKGAQAGREGRYSEALGHTVAGAIPILGPMAANIGEQMGSGDIAGGAGKLAGMAVMPKVYGAALKGAAGVARGVDPARVASSLERGAASRVVDVMAPKIGANKTRFGGMAEDVAPQLAKESVSKSWSREGLQEKVSTKLAEAETTLDDAASARNAAQKYPTQPILNELMTRRRQLTAETTPGESPMGGVVPKPNATRVAMIDQAMSEIRQLGASAPYEALRRIRQSYDGPAKAIYSPSMTQDFLTAQGGKLGAADVTGTLREALAGMDPATARANAQYSFWRKANDVLEATAEVERTRPKVGRIIAARIAATVFGGSAAGPAGAAAGLLGGPMIESILSAAPTTKLRTARLMTKLATAIRRGDVGHVNSLTAQLGQAEGATNPSVSPTHSAPVQP